MARRTVTPAEPVDALPHPPKDCSRECCGRKAAIDIARFQVASTIFTGTYDTQRGLFTYRNKGGLCVSTKDATFVEWITRCADCYSEEIVRTGKSHMPAIEELEREFFARCAGAERDRYPTAEQVERELYGTGYRK